MLGSFSFLTSIRKPTGSTFTRGEFWICIISKTYFLTVRWSIPVMQQSLWTLVCSFGMRSSSFTIRFPFVPVSMAPPVRTH